MRERYSGKKSKHNVYVSLLATDTTPFLEMDPKKLPASIPSLVYLSKDIKPTKDYEYLDMKEYLDHYFTDEKSPNSYL